MTLKHAASFAAGMLAALALVALLFWAGCGWRGAMAVRDMYGVLCQGLNTIYYGSAV